MSAITAVVAASGTIVSDATNPTADDTVTVGGVTYTWKASVTTTANQVKIGADAAASVQNLFDAINATASASGVTHGSLTVANPDVIATAVSATVVTVKARTPGTVGNFIPLTESGTHTAIGSAATKLAGGTGSIQAAIVELLAQAQLNAEVESILRSIDGFPAAF